MTRRSKKEVPTVTAISVTHLDRTREVKVVCPYCHDIHAHSWGLGDRRINYRMRHCLSPVRGRSDNYYLALPEE